MRLSVLLFAVVACATAPATKTVQERAATSQAPSASPPNTLRPAPEQRLRSLNGAAPASTNSCPGAFETSPADKAYFKGIQRAVAARGHGRDEVALHDPELKAFGPDPESARSTVVEVTLDGSGGLMKVVVTKTSGLNFIDHSAMTAFQEAQPFDNPPPDLAKLKCFRFRFGLTIERGVLPGDRAR